jgi:uncharacterized membrane protein YcfT
MPAFFALSGIFAVKLTRLPPGDFFANRLRVIFYPYVIWTAIIVAAQVAMSRFVNNPPDLARASWFLVEPYGYGLWFLYSLLIVSLVHYVCVRMKVPPLLIVFMGFVFSFLAARNLFGFWPALNTSMNFFIFYAAAAAFRQTVLAIFSEGNCLWRLALGAGLMMLMTMLHTMIPSQSWLTGLLMALSGGAGIMCFAGGISSRFTGLFWAFLGIYSLEIYLGHPLWGTLSRAILLHAGINSPILLVLSGVAIGTGGSLIIGVLSRWLKLPYLFRLPGRSAAKI